jgi:hypothetical protein
MKTAPAKSKTPARPPRAMPTRAPVLGADARLGMLGMLVTVERDAPVEDGSASPTYLSSSGQSHSGGSLAKPGLHIPKGADI